MHCALYESRRLYCVLKTMQSVLLLLFLKQTLECLCFEFFEKGWIESNCYTDQELFSWTASDELHAHIIINTMKCPLKSKRQLHIDEE